MSKESRRRQRATGQTSGSGPTPNRPAATIPSGRPSGAADGTSSRTPSSGPRGTERAGRRARTRVGPKPSFFQRYRTPILVAAVVGVIAIVGAGLFSAATQPAYACSNIWQPSPTATPPEGSSPQPGYVQPDMGQGHVPNGTQITYTYCPPASGRHYAQPAAPIQARVYGPDDRVIPQGWVHNLEHGGLVILYKGATVDQTALRALFDAIPASPVCGFPPGGQSPGPVIARFDDMAWPFAALVWGRVLPLESLDQQAILEFYAIWGEKTNPEKLCEAPSASPSAVPSAAPSSAAPSASPSGSAAPSSAAPSSAAPSASPSAS